MLNTISSWLFRPVLNAIAQLSEQITMDMSQLATALSGIGTSLTGVSDQLAKATAEIIAALANAGGTSPEVDAAVANLQTISTALAGVAKTLDDLNPDAPPPAQPSSLSPVPR